jgi:hypothetical protein
MECPCKDCKSRKTDCHAACEKYSEWSKELKAKKEKERQEQYFLSSAFVDVMKRHR